MAELPDLTVFAKTLNHHFKGHLLKSIEVTVAKKLNVKEKQLKQQLEGSRLDSSNAKQDPILPFR